jgi:hypothetical protein
VGAMTGRTHGFKHTTTRATISITFIHTYAIHFKKQLPLTVNSPPNKIQHLEHIDVQLIAKLKAVVGATELNLTRIEGSRK